MQVERRLTYEATPGSAELGLMSQTTSHDIETQTGAWSSTASHTSAIRTI